MNGQELYARWINAQIEENNSHPDNWDVLHPREQKAWDNLAEQIRVHVQDSIGKIFE